MRRAPLPPITENVDHTTLTNALAFAACFAFGFLVSGRRAVLAQTTRAALCALVACTLGYLNATGAAASLWATGAVLAACFFATYAALDVRAYAKDRIGGV